MVVGLVTGGFKTPGPWTRASSRLGAWRKESEFDGGQTDGYVDFWVYFKGNDPIGNTPHFSLQFQSPSCASVEIFLSFHFKDTFWNMIMGGFG